MPRRCPTCGQPVAATRTNPFCSDRCRLVDLGRWLDGDYRVAGPPAESSTWNDDPVSDAG